MPKVNLYIPETAYEILIRYKSNTGEKRQQVFGKSAIKRMKKSEPLEQLEKMIKNEQIRFNANNPFTTFGIDMSKEYEKTFKEAKQDG
jgi:CMP-2-keto-3-deoxyoctulosonic acid synthetase